MLQILPFCLRLFPSFFRVWMVVGDGLFLSLNNHSHNSTSFHSTASVKYFSLNINSLKVSLHSYWRTPSRTSLKCTFNKNKLAKFPKQRSKCINLLVSNWLKLYLFWRKIMKMHSCNKLGKYYYPEY